MSSEKSFQDRVNDWIHECFSPEVCRDIVERNHRFLEESLELVQSLGCTASEAHQLVDYVFSRPVGKTYQEVGGVAVTLAALCLASDLDVNNCGETELQRVWTLIEAIRAEHASKPAHSPLPQGFPVPNIQLVILLLNASIAMIVPGQPNLNLIRDMLRQVVALLAESTSG